MVVPIRRYCQLRNCRNYQSLLAGTRLDRCISSTIVEIIRAYQPVVMYNGQVLNLQQQKLLELTSPRHRGCSDTHHLQQQKLLELTSPCLFTLLVNLIYNSRNYQSLLAIAGEMKRVLIYNSRNYQSLLAGGEVMLFPSESTIVEIIRAYQPSNNYTKTDVIYNSRNYQSLLASLTDRESQSTSTIVEIIRAYQPRRLGMVRYQIYNSRNYQSLLAKYSQKWNFSDLQQQKLLELTSHRSSYQE